MTARRLAGLAPLTLALALGCGGSPPPRTDTAPATAEPAATTAAPEPEIDPLAGDAQIRFLHVATRATQTAVDGFGVDMDTPLFPGAAYKVPTAYAKVATSAGDVALLVRGQGLAEFTVQANVPPGSHNTVFVISDPASAEGLQLVTVDDDAPRAPAEAVRVRFFHALAGASAVDVCVAGAGRAPATLLFPGVGYGALAAYLDLPSPPPVRLQVRQASENECAGRQIGVVELAATEEHGLLGQNVTLVALGALRQPRGRPDVESEVLVSIDQPPQSSTFSLPLSR